MDEVDGMGGGDRGGNQELIKLIKKTRVPIICICNDRQKASVKSLANYCLDVRFQRPNADEIVGRMKLIMEHEGFKHVDVPTLKQLCTSVNNDIRQVLNLLQMLRLTTDRLDGQRGGFQASMAEGRHVELSPFTVVPTLFSASNRSLNDTIDLFFHDHDLMPLFIHENYLRAQPAQPPTYLMNAMANAADAISYGDLVKEQVMKQQDWSLLPFLGVISTAVPTAYTRGRAGQVAFPEWLGKNSTANKEKRLLKDLQVHMAAATTASDKRDVRLDYVPHMAHHLLAPLQQHGKEGVPELLALMEAYGITKDDWESVFTLLGQDEAVTQIPSQVRAAFTRAYNKSKPASVSSGKGKGAVARIADDDLGLLDEDVKAELEGGEEDGAAAEDGGDEDALKDRLIKQKKKPAVGKGISKGKEAAEPAKKKAKSK